MGCGSSKERPASARSWMAVDGWIPSAGPERQREVARTKSGKLQVEDQAKEKPKTGEESMFQADESRHIGDCSIGIADQQTFADKLNALPEGEMYTDDEFPPDNTSMYYSERSDPDVVWKRPKELADSPQLLINGESRSDIMQGQLGDCWFLSSCAALAQKKDFIDTIVPNQGLNLNDPDYRGYVRFKFWRFGQWVDVYIDDRLPTKQNRMMYARNTDPNEYWVPLLEKAYAKLHGSYEAIEGGQSMDALVDLTGGIAERYELTEHTEDLYKKLSKAAAHGAFITCSRKGDWKPSQQQNNNNNDVDEFGLVAGHAYTITDVKRIKRKTGAECLLRVRNPWGSGEEWKGAWSDKDHRWNLVDEETKNWLQYVQKNDGEFWIAFKDFCKQFQEVTVCTVGPDFQGDGVADGAATVLSATGTWVKDQTAGGCRNDIYSFSVNPQYLLTVFETDDPDKSVLPQEKSADTCNVLITLMQEHRRSQKHTAVKMLQIGFVIYSATDPATRLPVDHFLYNYEVAKSGTYVNFREISCRFELEPGYYVVVPTTFNKDEDGIFMMRMFSSKRISLQQLPDHTGPPPSPGDEHHDIIPPAVTEAPAGHYPYDPHHGNDENAWDPEIARATREDMKAAEHDLPATEQHQMAEIRSASKLSRPASKISNKVK